MDNTFSRYCDICGKARSPKSDHSKCAAKRKKLFSERTKKRKAQNVWKSEVRINNFIAFYIEKKD